MHQPLKIGSLLIAAGLAFGVCFESATHSQHLIELAHAAGYPKFMQSLQVSATPNKQGIEIRGSCHSPNFVLISSIYFSSPIQSLCEDGFFREIINSKYNEKSDLIVSNININGSIYYGIIEHPLKKLNLVINTNLNKIYKIIYEVRPGTLIKLHPGHYEDLSLTINQSGIETRPIVIDGEGLVRLSGNSKIVIRGDWVTIKGINFDSTEKNSVLLNGTWNKLTHSKFINCGTKPNDACVAAYGQKSEISFTDFIKSKSVSIQIRSDDFRIPKYAYIHHNRFMDITRLSDNGQEPIQISGKNGTTSSVEFYAKIESNIFYMSNGDPEAVSIKSSRNIVSGNVFKSINASPVIRGGRENSLNYNLIYDSLPVRLYGQYHNIHDNVFKCARGNSFIYISDEYDGHRATTLSKIYNNEFHVNNHPSVIYRDIKSQVNIAFKTVLKRNLVIGDGVLMDKETERKFSKMNDHYDNFYISSIHTEKCL